MKMTPIALAAGLVFAASSAFAGEDNFTKVDKDGSGKLSMEEVAEAHPEVDANLFKSIDTDGDGELSPKEYSVATNTTDRSKSSAQ